jgi:hypothetical protein
LAERANVELEKQAQAPTMKAWVGPAKNGWTVFSDPQTDVMGFPESMTIAIMGGVADAPSRLAIAAHVQDDDVLVMFAVTNGRFVFTYNSDPSYGDDNATSRATPIVQGEDALLAALGSDVDGHELHRLLWSPEKFALATELHAKVAAVMGLPAYVAGFGFNYAEQGDLGFNDLEQDQLTRTGP